MGSMASMLVVSGGVSSLCIPVVYDDLTGFTVLGETEKHGGYKDSLKL